jgi:hypothetical protein
LQDFPAGVIGGSVGEFPRAASSGKERSMNCSAGRCRIQCEEGQGCACVHIYEGDQCICECFEREGPAAGLNAGLTKKVDISVSGLPLGQVATILDGILARDVLLPAARAQEKVRLKMKGVRVSDALKALGLTTQRPAAGARAKR